ncbi:dimethylarginine dimethylaminohydrolase family protein [Reichenbachiella sp.]|uniref:dimethylarginine dimethylaminohydrolase family protein n=1 Tax=Reichenbachiella sp. TaxID=2184521 RepID=UPI003B5BD3A1
MKTSHSEFGAIESIVIKRVKDAFINQNHIVEQWKYLNYLGEPNLNKALNEYETFQGHIKNNCTQLFTLPQNDSVGMDSMYCRDASIATDFGMIICNMGKEARSNEPKAEKDFFLANDIPILGEITAPGTLEGGDVAWVDQKTLAVGHTYRTNEEGIRQLKALLEPKGIEIIVAQLPHYKGQSDVFHLMSILSPVDKELAVIYSPLMPIDFRNFLLDRGYRFVEVPDEEFDSMGCNVLALAPSNCLMVEGNPITQQRLIDAGCEVITYKGEEISVKGGGGPTCLTRPIWRNL